MARDVRQGCPASGFLFPMAFDPMFRWLQEAIIPTNPAGLDVLQPLPCAYADDLAVAAPSFRCSLTALAPAFQMVDQTAGLSLNHRKCCWVQHGSESCQYLLEWVATNCEELGEVKIVKYAKYVGTMIGPEGHAHRWTAPRKNHSTCSKKLTPPPKALLRDCATLRSMSFRYWVYIGSISAPDEATLKAEAIRPAVYDRRSIHCHSHQRTVCWFICGLGPDLVGIHSISLAARCRTAACSNTLNQGLEKIQASRGYDFAPIFALEKFLVPSMARSAVEAFDVVRRLDHSGELDESRQDQKQKAATALLRDNFFEQDFAGPISLHASRILGPISRFRREILPHMKLVARLSSWAYCWIFTRPLQWAVYGTKISH